MVTWIRIWGCKCYALKPKADRRKDFDEKAYTGFLVGYAQQNTGYWVLSALNKSESRDPKDYEFLVGLQHIDDKDGLVLLPPPDRV